LSSLSPSDLAPNLLVGVRVEIADDVEIGANVILHDNVTVQEGVRLDHGAVLGRLAYRSRGSRTPSPEDGLTLIEAEAIVCPYALVSAGVRMGPHSFLGDHSHVREGTRLGADVALGAMCGVGRNVQIGEGTRIQTQTLIGPNVTIERDCFMGPGVQVVTGRTMGASSSRESAPVLRRGCQIGAGARILPGLEIGEAAVIAAGAVVVADVAPGEVVGGVPARQIASRRDVPVDGAASAEDETHVRHPIDVKGELGQSG